MQHNQTSFNLKASIILRGVAVTSLYQNTSKLGSWSATITTTTTTILNITTTHAHGLIFGRVENTRFVLLDDQPLNETESPRFSFSISSSSSSQSTTSISLLLPSLPSSATVCLWIDEEHCQQVVVTHHQLLPHNYKKSASQTVESIPVVWQRQDVPDSINQSQIGSEAWSWLTRMISIPDPLLWFINTIIVIFLIIMIFRCLVCLLPKCGKK